MKVIKRDGREAEYDRNKIVHAIQKANNEVEKEDRISEEKFTTLLRPSKTESWRVWLWRISRISLSRS